MIDTNNKLKSLSRSLLEAAQSVMTTEAKKVNKHGHDPVGKEDADIDNDGDVDTSDKYLHNRRKAIGKAMMKKEEVEVIDELSKGKLTDYRAAAKKQGTNIQNKMKIGGGDWSKDGSDTKTLSKRMAGYKMAGRKTNPDLATSVGKGVKVPANEEVEAIDELSRKTLASYVPKAANRMAQSHASVVKARHDYDSAAAIDHATSSTPSNVRDMAKSIIRKDASKREIENLKDVQNRHQGIERATKRLAKEEVEAIDEALDAAARYGQHHGAIKELMKSITQHVESHKSDALKRRDYRGRKGVNWGHVGDVAQIHSQLADIHDRLAQQGEYKKSLGESVEDLDIEQIDELSTKTLKSYRSAARTDAFDAADVDDEPRFRKRAAGSNAAGKKLAKRGESLKTEARVDGVAPGSMDNDGHLCATKVMHREWSEGTPIHSQHAQPDADGHIAWYDVMFEHGIEKHVPTDEMEILMSEMHGSHKRKKMKENVELDEKMSDAAKAAIRGAASAGAKVRPLVGLVSKYGKKATNEEAELDEARGRPRKNPLPIADVEPEPRLHIMQQLQRAKLSMRGGEHVTFKDGTKHHISGEHAAKILTRYAGMKPSEKEDFQKKIGGSHSAFKEEL